MRQPASFSQGVFSRLRHWPAWLLLASTASAMASIPQPGDKADCDEAALVFEQSSVPATFDVYATDAQHRRFGDPIIEGVEGVLQRGGNFFGAVIEFPASPDTGRCDFENVTHLAGVARGGGGLGGGGGGGGLALVSDFSIESLILTANNKVEIEGTAKRLRLLFGSGQLRLPDLYSTEFLPDSDGVFTLYSLVDIRQFALTTPHFDLGDIFSIVNGESTALPGMLFSTTPFDFSADTGFTGTPFTGEATALTLHIVQAVPEPGSLALVLGAMAVLFGLNVKTGRSAQNGHRPIRASW